MFESKPYAVCVSHDSQRWCGTAHTRLVRPISLVLDLDLGLGPLSNLLARDQLEISARLYPKFTTTHDMDRSNSLASNASTESKASALGPFAYQTRLLERTSSLRTGSSLSRSNSRSSTEMPSTNGSSGSPPSARKWTPSHRPANSLDAVRGKWEERARLESLLDPQIASNQSREPLPRGAHPCWTSHPTITDALSLVYESYPSTPPDSPTGKSSFQRTPPHLKRHTMPAPIITSPLSPNTTGVSVFSPASPLSAFPSSTTNRIHVPTATQSRASPLSGVHTHLASNAPLPLYEKPLPVPPSRYRRSNTINGGPPNFDEPSGSLVVASPSTTSLDNSRRGPNLPPGAGPALQRRPILFHGNRRFSTSSSDKPDGSISLTNISIATTSSERPSTPPYEPESAPDSQSVTTLTPYKSSYMTNKRSSMYGDQLSAGYRLGRHLPRIASGDGDDHREDRKMEDEVMQTEKVAESSRTRNVRGGPLSPPRSREPVNTTIANENGVAGVPGRIRFTKDKTPSTPASPAPSSRLVRGGLWADTQRHLLLAYEYLCHVGEAQQWIEGCLGEELGFGVVEMEDGLRNGVVLAKLARVFQGPSVVKKIYEVRTGLFFCTVRPHHPIRLGAEAGFPTFRQYQLFLQFCAGCRSP
jgi:Ras GTPase-activating-like protein IQGAP2/3